MKHIVMVEFPVQEGGSIKDGNAAAHHIAKQLNLKGFTFTIKDVESEALRGRRVLNAAILEEVGADEEEGD